MKKPAVILLFLVTAISLIMIKPISAQTPVNCDLTLITTIEGFDVYNHNPTGVTMYKAKMYIDADGSPRAYGPGNSGLDWTANAGSPGNWWGVVTDNNGDPIIQGSGDPFPGMYVSTTSLVNSSYSSTNPLRYANSETVPFFVLPTAVVSLGGITIGDIAYVYNTITGQGCYAIYADSGPAGKLGEGSIYLAGQIGVDPNARTGGTSSEIIDYIVFPGSGYGQGTIPSIAQINSIGSTMIATVGGTCITSCLGSNPCDPTAPTTQISTPSDWVSNSFTSTFTDIDNTGGSGLEKSYYQVLDYDGAEWHANAGNGFFADNFDSYNSSVWTVPASSGTWQVSGGNLIQNDSSVNNSNIYASLDQNLSNRYLYQFNAMIDPATNSGSQHRFGFHFFSDDGSLTQRGNSYFIFFRQETSKLEFYKVVNNSPTLESTVSNVITAFGQWNDYKIIFDRTTGKIDVYRDDVFLGTWTDSNVLTNTGDYISFRTGNCKASITELKVYRSRLPSVTISVGAAATNDIRYQNPDSATYAGKIKSIVNDVAGNLSTIVSKNIYVDWTAPSCVTVNDGNVSDIDATASMTSLSSNWTTSTDPNSGIAKYWYAIGTTSGATDVVNWTNNNLNTSVTNSTLSLTQGQNYYFSVKAENSAGLNSICSSDGIIADVNTGIDENENAINITAQPNPFNENVTLFFSQKKEQKITISLTDVLGKEIKIADAIFPTGKNSIDINTEGLYLEKGVYIFKISSDYYSTSLRVIKY